MITHYLPNQLTYSNKSFFNDVSKKLVLKYLKGVYGSKNHFKRKFLSKSNNPLLDDIITYFEDKFDDAKPFTFKEAFELENREFQAIVFNSIDITEMINELGNKRLNVEGKPVKRKQFDSNGNFIGYKEYDVIYETYSISGEKLGIVDDFYAVKCWCTSTNKEHWLWIEEKYKNKPLEAIASTFRIHKNLIPHIKELKRQGDVLLVELNKKVKPDGEIIPLTSEQYFNLLTTET